MPATRSGLRRPKHVDCPVDFGEGEVVTFVIDANKMTDAWMDDWSRAEKEAGESKLNAMLDDLIEAWDIYEHEGGPLVPVSETEIGKLFSLSAKSQMMREFGDLPSDAEGNASRNISSTPGDVSSSTPASPQNGPSPSPTPEPVASPSSTQPT